MYFIFTYFERHHAPLLDISDFGIALLFIFVLLMYLLLTCLDAMLLSRAAELGVYVGSESPTSELNGLQGDYSGLSELGGYSMGRPNSEDLNDLGQRDCHSPVSSIDEIERAVAGNFAKHSVCVCPSWLVIYFLSVHWVICQTFW